MTTETASREIVVIGAGIVGMACASYIQRAGHRVTVLDRGRVQGMAGLGPVHGEGGHSARGLEDQVAVGHGGYDRSR